MRRGSLAFYNAPVSAERRCEKIGERRKIVLRVIPSGARNLALPLPLEQVVNQSEIPRCHENDSPPQREEGQGVVGGSVSVPVNHP